MTHLAKLIAIVMVLVLSTGMAFANFAGGSGTERDPWQIANAQQLNSVRNYLGIYHADRHFLQIADIDLGKAPWNQGEGWEPIGSDKDNSFYASYDGGGKAMYNLFIDRPSSYFQGLFGYFSGKIRNLKLENVNVKGYKHVGALVGYNNGQIDNWFSSGTVVEVCHGAQGAADLSGTIDPKAVTGTREFVAASRGDGAGAAPTGPVTTTGNQNQAQAAVLGKPIAVSKTEQAAISNIQSQAKAVTEETIASAPQESQTDLQALRGIVNNRKAELQSLYRKAASTESISGAIDITIYGSGGKIEAVNVKPTSGNLTNAFLQDIQRVVKAWPGTQAPFIYTFTMRFGS